VPQQTIAGISRHPFYSALAAAQEGTTITPARLAAARADLQRLNVGWVLVWPPRWLMPQTRAAYPPGLSYRPILRYLAQTGFIRDYQADGVMVYRPAHSAENGQGTWPANGEQARMRAGHAPLRPLA
jgi:predicted deacetylase